MVIHCDYYQSRFQYQRNTKVTLLIKFNFNYQIKFEIN